MLCRYLQDSNGSVYNKKFMPVDFSKVPLEVFDSDAFEGVLSYTAHRDGMGLNVNGVGLLVRNTVI